MKTSTPMSEAERIARVVYIVHLARLEANIAAFQETPRSIIRTQLRWLDDLAATESSQVDAAALVLANIFAGALWLAKSEGVEHTSDLLDACANRLIKDQAELLGCEA